MCNKLYVNATLLDSRHKSYCHCNTDKRLIKVELSVQLAMKLTKIMTNIYENVQKFFELQSL